MTITRKPLARPGTLTAKAIALINSGKGRKDVVAELGLKNDFTYYNALRKIRNRRKEYAANRTPETSGNPANGARPFKAMAYELHIIDPNGNRVKFTADTPNGVKSLCSLLNGLGEE